jgi:hypothetical protein
MAALFWLFFVFAAALFIAKVAFVVCTVTVLPVTEGALYVSTSRVRITAFLDAVPMTSAQLLVDLGCGDGRVLRKAYFRYGVRTRGYEMNLLAYAKAQLLSLWIKGVEVRRCNFWREDLSDADVVFCYLFPDVMKRLSAKLRSELKPGAVVASCNFPLPGFRPERILRPQGSLHSDPIFLYRWGSED